MLTYHLMKEMEKYLISEWKYSGDYAVYNLPPYQEQIKKQVCFAHPERTKNYYSYYNNKQLIGFTNILEKETGICIGIGVHPDYCGKGYGKEILDLASKLAKEMYPNRELYLDVRTWNTRAIKCYEKAGFVILGKPFKLNSHMVKGEFYRMIKS